MLVVLVSVRFWRLFYTDAVLWGHAGCLLSGVERCPLLGVSKCTISIGRAIGNMEFVRYAEVVCLSESPLLEVSLYVVWLTRISKYMHRGNITKINQSEPHTNHHYNIIQDDCCTYACIHVREVYVAIHHRYAHQRHLAIACVQVH